MTPLVVDCSVTMAWCFEDECDELADAVLDRLADGEAWVPSLWPLEVANVIRITGVPAHLVPCPCERLTVESSAKSGG